MKKGLRILLFILFSVLIALAALYMAGGGFGLKEVVRAVPGGDHSVLLFAHRGIGNYFPENSMEGFDAAAVRGFKAIETDIHLSSDDVPVIFHDDNCERLLGTSKNVNEFTAAELGKQKILFGGKPSAASVVMLSDVFERYGDRFTIYLDVKLHSIHMAKKMAETIEQYHLQTKTIVANSNLLFIAYIEYYYPEINTVLEGFTPGKEWMYSLIPKKLKPDYLSSFAKDITAEHMAWISKHQLSDKRMVYGVTKDDLGKVIASGIQNIILDYDSSMQQTVEKYR